MKFIYQDLGNRKRGDILVVTLSAGANVRLLNSSNYQRYKRGERHSFHGGLAKVSPLRIAIPSNGHWYAVVDMQGLRGSVRANFQVINGEALRPLPPIQQRHSELADIAENLAAIRPASDEREFDVFISHATEDKDDIVRPLAAQLLGLGLTVWFDEFEMQIGDSLRRKIDSGISRSRYGIVVLSQAFFAKSWPQYELDGLVTMAVSGRQVLLPLWHNISKDEVTRHSPSLADKIALRTSDYTVEEIAREISDVVIRSSAGQNS